MTDAQDKPNVVPRVHRYRVWCVTPPPTPTGLPRCGWAGYRMATGTSKAEKKPCPKCGGDVLRAVLR